jgi:hypothetical protein
MSCAMELRLLKEVRVDLGLQRRELRRGCQLGQLALAVHASPGQTR